MGHHQQSYNEHRSWLLWRHCSRSYIGPVHVPLPLHPASRSFVDVQVLLPCGFQVRAWRVMLDGGFLDMCSVQPHFRRLICISIGSCPAFLHRSSIETLLGHLMLKCARDRCCRRFGSSAGMFLLSSMSQLHILGWT